MTPPHTGAYARLDGTELRLGNAYHPPVNWQGGKPYRLEADERDIAQAAALVSREGSTLSEKESIRWRTILDEVCYRVAENAGLEAFGPTLVWYHPDTRDFWAYPKVEPYEQAQ
jgi:hypothetical protein